METLETLLIFLILVILSSMIHAFFSKIPLAFIQIGLGVLLFLTPIPINFEFDTEVFMVTLIAPLLFVEGVHVSRVNLRRYIRPVMMMALGLVVTTVIVVGFFVHWIWPDLPMPAAFALAAILCPTDAVALQAITKGKVLPKGSMTILEGESLLNDAAGIISFKIAVAALVTGAFSVTDAITQFLISSIGGLIVGLLIGFFVVKFRITLMRKGVDNINMFTFIQLLTPFVTYIVAESVHASGIIAAVVAGLIHGFERDRIAQAKTRLQLSYNHTWNILSYALNGFVFAILGYLVPEVVQRIIKEEPQNLIFLSVTTLLVALAVYVFRYLWVLVLYPHFYIPQSPFQRILSQKEEHSAAPEKPPKRSKYAFIMALCGVHGTISLAIALTLPHLLKGGHEFVFRDDLLFIASGMVLISLIVAQFVLPRVTPSAKKVQHKGMTFKEARIYILEKAIEHLNQNATIDTSYNYASVVKEYHDKLAFLKTLEKDDENTKELERLQKIAFEVETDTMKTLIKNGEITPSVFENYMRYSELTQMYKQASLVQRALMRFRASILRRHLKTNVNATSSLSVADNLEEIAKIMRTVHYNVLSRLADERVHENKLEIGMVCDSYLMRIENLTPSNFFNPQSKSSITKVKLDGLRDQRNILNDLLEDEKISEATALKLRESINYDEMVIVDSLT